jgi:hypothetical protein
MTQALAVASPRESATAWIGMMGPAAELANVIGNTDFVPKDLRGKPAAITAAVLTGYELGIGPMTALAQICVIDGKPTLYAALMRALVLDRGHNIWFEELTSTKVVCAGHRRGESEVTRVTWTRQRAVDAGLAGKPTWRAHMEMMLAARASAELCRLIFADCLAGLVHAAEEIQDGDGVDRSEPPAGDASPTRGSTRRRPQATVVDAPPPPERPPLPGENDTQPGQQRAAEQPPTADAAAASPPPSQSPAMKRLHSLFRQVGLADRADRLAVSSLILERQVESSKDLTEEELEVVCGRLADVVEKRVQLSKNGDAWSIA